MHLIADRPMPPRRGLTLVEMLVVIVLLSVVAGGMLGIVARQQRFYSGTAGVIDTRSRLRQASGVLAAGLRSISPSNGDIIAMGRTFIEFRATIGSSVLCQLPVPNTIVLPPLNGAAKNALTSWISEPGSGDGVLIYDTNRKPGVSDDTWDLSSVDATPVGGATCPNITGLTTTAGEATKGISILLSSNVAATVTLGAPIRFFRQVRYQLYQASDGKWYLGYRDCPGGSVTCPLAPVLGPFLPAANAGPSGLELSYVDANNAATADPTQVQRIDVTLRAPSETYMDMQGRAPGVYQDTLSFSIAVRN